MGLFSTIGKIAGGAIGGPTGAVVGSAIGSSLDNKQSGGGGSAPSAAGGAGGGQQMAYSPGHDANLYLIEAATALGPAKAELDIAAGQLAKAEAPYYAGLGTQLGLRAQGGADQLGITQAEATGSRALELGLASQYAGLAAQTLGDRAQGMTALGLYGPGVQADLAKAYGTQAAGLERDIIQGERTLLGKGLEGQRALQQQGLIGQTTLQQQGLAGQSGLLQTGLSGEQSLLQPTATGLVQAGLGKLVANNQAVQNLLNTNLGIRKAEQDTMNQLALARMGIEGQLALRRDARSAAGAAAQAIA